MELQELRGGRPVFEGRQGNLSRRRLCCLFLNGNHKSIDFFEKTLHAAIFASPFLSLGFRLARTNSGERAQASSVCRACPRSLQRLGAAVRPHRRPRPKCNRIEETLVESAALALLLPVPASPQAWRDTVGGNPPLTQ